MAINTPNEMPVVALRGRVLFPNTVASFDAGRIASLAAIKRASEMDMRLFVCAQKDAGKTEISPEDIYEVGTVVKIKQITRLPSNSVRLLVEGLYRARARRIYMDGTFLSVVDEIKTIRSDSTLEEAYFRTAKDILKDIASSENHFSKEAISQLESCSDPDILVNIAAHNMPLRLQVKQELLERERIVDRLRIIEKCLNDELEIMRLERKIQATVRQNIDKNQKEYYLREQLKAIHAELGDDEEEKDELRQKILEKGMPEEVEQKALKELSRMGRMHSSSPEYNVIRLYLDWLLDIPWTEQTTDTQSLSDAVKILNEDHYGLEKIKERITEYLAVLKLTGGMNAPILCFVGPPGVGKTSIAQSVARALGRNFVRMSLGGVKDESEIRGHRKTYIGSMPGRIITALKNSGSINPVFLLDEIDKLSSDMRGDPASALLEVLDPAQNSTFRDRYLEVPYDLSKILFITTANSLEGIPAPLLDRMELIELNGYTQEEKVEIAKRYLVPKKRTANGLEEADICLNEEVLNAIIAGYTREAGVRSLERKIDTVCRKVAVKKAGENFLPQTVTVGDLEEYLGTKRYDSENDIWQQDQVGAATGLAWTAVGGTTLTIEVAAMQGKGDILLTGKLGEVMKESARAAISYIRSNCDEYGIDYSVFEKTDIHVHVPEGATPKDGPSAGITMATAILSAFTHKPVKKSVAMTGEITLRGKVLPIGGLKEKALAAYRIGITDVIIPEENQKDLQEIPENIKSKLNFIPVSSVDTVFKSAIVGL
ncbi:MAG: endopeptidase La [Clostridiales bacterium]|nr:endopeptidase La [Clostridiales bacterium]